MSADGRAEIELTTVLMAATNAGETHRILSAFKDEHRVDVLVEAEVEIALAIDRNRAEHPIEDAMVARRLGMRHAERVVRGMREEVEQDTRGQSSHKSDGQAYDGELAMYRGLVRTLRTASRCEDFDAIRQALINHASDDAAARQKAKEKSSPTGADATPDFFQPGHTYASRGAWTFKPTSVVDAPDGQRVALGFIHGDLTYGAGAWTPHGEYDLDGWTDVTDTTQGDSK